MKGTVGHSSWRVCLVVVLPLLAHAAGGCSTPHQEEKYEGINRVSTNGSNLYFRAKMQYGNVRALARIAY